jgi:hypothetical protein
MSHERKVSANANNSARKTNGRRKSEKVFFFRQTAIIYAKHCVLPLQGTCARLMPSDFILHVRSTWVEKPDTFKCRVSQIPQPTFTHARKAVNLGKKKTGINNLLSTLSRPIATVIKKTKNIMNRTSSNIWRTVSHIQLPKPVPMTKTGWMPWDWNTSWHVGTDDKWSVRWNLLNVQKLRNGVNQLQSR